MKHDLTPQELDEVVAWADRGTGCTRPGYVRQLVNELRRDRIRLAEVGEWGTNESNRRIAAETRLAVVEAERDKAVSMHEHSAASAREFWQRAEAAETKLAAVEALCDENPHAFWVPQVRAAARGEAADV